MSIAIGSDHAGYHLKERIKQFLDRSHIEYKDFGTHSTESVDYPDIAIQVAKAVSENKAERGILICNTGIGMSLVANKVPHIRAALCISAEIAKLARVHNDANLLALGSLETDPQHVDEIVKTFLETPFEKGGRHERRVKKIHDLTGI
jgi:ribose 5-phosphate isomerase B